MLLSYVNSIHAHISRGIKFANINENKVLANNSEFTVYHNTWPRWMQLYFGEIAGLLDNEGAFG